MQFFITALQFLTRIHIKQEQEWSAERFGKSVAFFPVVGLVIGMILVGLNHFVGLFLSVHFTALLLVIAGMVITGALHCDGLMDTADGLLSGRSRERKLEIMKDSRVGASGVTVFVLLVLLKWTALEEIPLQLAPFALLTMPVVARLVMSCAVTLFPYARPEGIGKLFAQYAGKRQAGYAALLALVVLLPLVIVQPRVLASCIVSLLFAGCFCRYASGQLGGLTGDIYGAATELTELVVLLTFLV